MPMAEFLQVGNFVNALRKGWIDEVREFLDNHPGYNLNQIVDDDNTPLNLAVSAGHYELTKFLLDKGADPNVKGKFDFSPLWFLMPRKDTKLLQLLLSYKADPNLLSGEKKECSMFMLACGSKGHLENVKLLYAAGADINLVVKDSSGEDTCALRYAMHFKNPDIVAFLLEKGVNIETCWQGGPILSRDTWGQDPAIVDMIRQEEIRRTSIKAENAVHAGIAGISKTKPIRFKTGL